VSRQPRGKAKAASSTSEPGEDRGAAPRERDRDREDPATELQPDPTTPGDYVGPPLSAKTNPPDAMDDALPSLDDEHRSYRHHPSENEAIEFEIDPLAGDAAADLAADLGSQFLEGATRGEDLGSRVLALDDDSDAPLDLLLDEGDRESDDETEAEAEAPPAPPRPSPRRRSR
jgi:hypothetical protein